MKKKIIGIFVCMLLIATVLSVSGNVMLESTLTPLSSGNTLYVGGSGPGNYTKIQDAVDNTSNGDTVFVYDDSSPYYERVKINKSINLIGEYRNTTVIDANRSGDAIFIASDEVSIHEFTLQNSEDNGIEIDIHFGFCTISDNIIIDNTEGIYMRYSCNNTIEGNTFFDNEDFTIMMLFHCNNNTITGNSIDHSPGTYHLNGIHLLKSTENNISDNTIKDSSDGIVLQLSDYNLVSNNIIRSNQGNGIRIDESSNNSIIGNNISYNLDYGISIGKAISKNNIIYHNNFYYENAKDEGNNIWDDGEYGNYWSNYEDKYPDAKKKPLKGIWDTPYEISAGDNKDMCPLIKQWPDPLSKSSPNNENVWFYKWLERFPILEKMQDVLGRFYNFYENMKGGI